MRIHLKAGIALLCGALWAFSLSAQDIQIYHWQHNGVAVFSDIPPTDKAYSVITPNKPIIEYESDNPGFRPSATYAKRGGKQAQTAKKSESQDYDSANCRWLAKRIDDAEQALAKHYRLNGRSTLSQKRASRKQKDLSRWQQEFELAQCTASG